MYGYIYKTTNNVNGRTYVGQHHGKFCKKYLGSGLALQRAVRKYGHKAFSVAFICEAGNQEELDLLEIDNIAKAKSIGERLYNISPGGKGIKPEVSVKISHALTGRKFSKEHLEKIRARLQTPEWKAFISAVHRGRVVSEEQKKRHSEFMRGRVHSAETRAKMSESQTKRFLLSKPSENTRRKLAETWAIRKALLAKRLAGGEIITIHDISTTGRTRAKNASTTNANN